MSDTLTLPFVRFTRQFHTDPATLTAWLATLAAGIEGLKTAPWVAAAAGTAATLPLSDPTGQFESQSYDAFKASGDAAASRQAAYLGMAAYRFKIPADALAGTAANIESVAVKAYADKFLWKGLLLAAYVSASDTPSADWAVLRSGDVATALTDGVGVLPEPDPATATATNKSAVLTMTPAAALAPQAYLWLVVQLADWEANAYEYWIEGAGMLEGSSVAVTFDRDVTADAPDTTWAYPVEKEDVCEPSTVFPLDPLANDLVSLASHELAVVFPFNTERARAITSHMHASALVYVILWDDGTITAAGDDTYGQVSGMPSGLTGVVSVCTRGRHCIALKDDGTVVAWGDNTYGQTTVPSGLTNVVAVAAGYWHSLALRSDGQVLAWGSDTEGQATVSGTLRDVVAISACETTSMALLADGTVSAWGRNVEGQTSIPGGLSGVVAIASGGSDSYALKDDGTVVRWGSSTTLPAGLAGVTVISAARDSYVFILSDGTVVAKGDSGIRNPISGLANAVFADAGSYGLFVGSKLSTAAAKVQWVESTIQANKNLAAFQIGLINDYDAQRGLIVRRVVDSAARIVNARTDDGQFKIANDGTWFELSAAACGFKFRNSATNATPNRLHLSLPALSAGAYGETRLRVMVLKETATTDTSPAATIANWQKLWRGETPAGYSLLASAIIRHTGFENSRVMTISSPGADSIIWVVILPLYAPLAGESLAWDIEQTSFNASHIFLLRV
jgi:hypothetical protein